MVKCEDYCWFGDEKTVGELYIYICTLECKKVRFATLYELLVNPKNVCTNTQIRYDIKGLAYFNDKAGHNFFPI